MPLRAGLPHISCSRGSSPASLCCLLTSLAKGQGVFQSPLQFLHIQCCLDASTIAITRFKQSSLDLVWFDDLWAYSAAHSCFPWKSLWLVKCSAGLCKIADLSSVHLPSYCYLIWCANIFVTDQKVCWESTCVKRSPVTAWRVVNNSNVHPLCQPLPALSLDATFQADHLLADKRQIM